MGWFDTLKAAIKGVAIPSPPSTIGAIAGAVGGIANAVTEEEKLAQQKQLLSAGQSEGVLADVQKTEERVAAAGAAHDDQQLLDSVKTTRFRD